MTEFEAIDFRTDINGCGGDCDNCDCSSVCSYARSSDEEYYDEEE